MPDSILDWIKKQGADFISRTVIPLFAVDDSPPTLADGEARPGTLNKTTGGINVHVANAGDIGASGGGGGEVTQGTGDVTKPWYMQGIFGGMGERLATAALQGAGLPAAFTGGGGIKTGLVDAIPAGANTIGKTDQGAGSGSAAGYYTVRLSDGSAFLPFPTALIGGRFDINNGAWLGSTAPTVGQKTAANSIPVILASDNGISVYMPTWPAGQLSPPANQIPWTMVGAGGRPTGGQNWVPFATNTSGFQIIMGSRVARSVHLASATLPAAGAFTAQTFYTVPEGVVEVTAYITYTRGAIGGQVVLRPQYGNDTETAYETAIVTSTESGGTVRETISLREILGPIVNTASAITFAIEFSIPPGCTRLTLLVAEVGVTGTPGIAAIALTGKYGA